ncbi:MAG: UDP-N-acetylmuramoyl-tripeptide--D-alanyl-D-alanine ligase [Desulfovermiculus sp.]|nr:UDP-N-acetylmuramoyl-tripeptide--D-alanyl-D-alanine ligase [Desulfovermiculus sp.]
MKLSLAQIGQAMQAVGDFENSQDVVASRVQTDSRLVQPGDVFVCITGQRFDGHNFAREAVHKGALTVVVERPLLELSSEVPMLLVQDSIQALADLAAHWRRQFQGRVVAITGTAGKTSVKEMIASILAQSAVVDKSYKNWNNRLGVSLSVLGMHGREDYWVMEAGVSEMGEMDDLAAVLAPDVAVMVNVGPAHLQGLHSVAGVAGEKSRLVEAVVSGGVAVISRDYPQLVQAVPAREDIKVVTFSTQADSSGDFRLASMGRSPVGGLDLHIEDGAQGFALHLPGELSWIGENVLAAASVTRYLGSSVSDIQTGLSHLRLPEHRGHVVPCGPMTIFDDCYNANPLSMRWALDWAGENAGTGPLILILGEMKELGDRSESCHWDLGFWAGKTGAAHVFFYGNYAQAVRQGYDRAGGKNLHHIQGQEDFIHLWRELGIDSGLVLVKGSRGCTLERFVHLLQQEFRA